MSLSVLHVGSGREPLPAWLDCGEEVRLDIDPSCEPHIVASMLDMGQIGPFDALYSSHCLEHLYPYQVTQALEEFKRVLRPGGVAVIIVPDLQGVQATEDVLIETPAGPITGLDMIYGKGSLIAQHPYMAHHCGFVRETLRGLLDAAGFTDVVVVRDTGFNLVAAAKAP